MSENYFAHLNSINVKEKIEQKNGLSYLSWAWAWAEVKKLHPDANYTVYENRDGLNYHTDGKTCWVKTGVTVNGIEHIEYLPVMNNRNLSIPLNSITSMDVNKAIQRSITKACARHGLGLYIYAGEDLPEDEGDQAPPTPPPPPPAPTPRPPQQRQMATMDQIQYIIDNADDANYQGAMEAFGANLERMSYKQAEKLIERIKGGC